MSFINFFTQGGQTQLHSLRMIRQVVLITALSALILGCIVFLWTVNRSLPQGTLPWVHASYLAEFKLSWPFIKNPYLLKQSFKNPNGRVVEVRCVDMIRHPYAVKAKRLFKRACTKGATYGALTSLLSFIIMSVFWIIRGRANKQKKLLSGVQVTSAAALKNLIIKQRKASSFALGGIPLLQNEETKHMLLSGTTGTGKTNALHELLPQIRRFNQRAIIVDLTGDYVAKYYDADQDIILNSLDERSVSWDMFAEVVQPYHEDDLAASLIPDSLSESFWTQAARLVFVSALRKVREKGTLSIHALYDLLTKLPAHQLERFLKGTEAASLMNKDSDKTAASIRATLTTAIRALRYLQSSSDRPDFSVRQWVQEEESSGWLFLTASPDQRESLRPLLSSWIAIALSSLMSFTPNTQRRLWFILDELPALHKLSSLSMGLAEARKYGGAFVLGVQDIHQLEKIYGHHEAKSILGLLNTKVIFRCADDQSALRLSHLLGEQEQSEMVEGLSFGAHHMRDGVSLSDQRRIRQAITPTDLMLLKDLEAIIKLPQGFPLAKIRFKYQGHPMG